MNPSHLPFDRARVALLALFAALSVQIGGCTVAPVRPSLAEIQIYAAGTGSAFLPYVQGLSAHLRAAGLKAMPVETSGSIENARRLGDTPNALGAVVLDVVSHAESRNAGPAAQSVYKGNLRALFPMYETAYQLVALRRSGIADVRSLRGKRVGVGPAGGPSELYFKGFAAALGLDFQPITGTPADIAAGVVAGRIDAWFQGGSVPAPGIALVTDAADAVVFGLNAEELAVMHKLFPYLADATVPTGSYRGQTAPLATVSAWNFMLAHKDLPEADAYWITRTVLSVDDPAKLHPLAAPTRAANAVYNTTVPFHAGALRYYTEQGVRGLK